MTDEAEVTKQVSSATRRAAVLWSVLIVSLLIMLSVVPGFLGYRPVRTWGTSMEPTLHDGDALLVKHVDPDEVKVGDIVTLEYPGKGPIAHRVVRIEPLPQGGFLFQTKGDANQSSEWWKVAAEEKIAVAFVRIPSLGRALEFIQTMPGRVLLAVNAIALLVVLTMMIKSRGAHGGG